MRVQRTNAANRNNDKDPSRDNVDLTYCESENLSVEQGECRRPWFFRNCRTTKISRSSEVD